MSIDIKIQTDASGKGKSAGTLVGEAMNGNQHRYPVVTIDSAGYIHLEADPDTEVTVQITYGE